MSKPALRLASQNDDNTGDAPPPSPATMYVRIKPTSARASHGLFGAGDFYRGRGWYEVPGDVAAKLATARDHSESPPDDHANPRVFDVASSLEEAAEIERRDKAEEVAAKVREEAKIGSVERPIRPTQIRTRDERAEAEARAARATAEARAAIEELERFNR